MASPPLRWLVLASACTFGCASTNEASPDAGTDAVASDAPAAPEEAVAADAGTELGDDVPPAPTVYGSVVTVTGKAIVFDPATLAVKISIPVTHTSMHGPGLRDAARVLWAPEPTKNRVDRIEIAKDWSTSTVETSIPLTAAPSFLEMSPDGKIVATGSATPVLGVQGTATSNKAAFIDADAKVLRAELPFDSPAHIQFAPDGSVAYVLQQKTGDIPVVDMKTFTVVDTLVNPGFKEGQTASGEGDVRPSDGYMCVANLTSSSVTCMDPKKPADAWIEKFSGEGPHDLCFDASGERLWIQAAAGITSPGDEFGNTEVPTTIFVLDVASHARLNEIHWDFSFWHVATGPGGRMFVSASWGSLLAYDDTTYELVGSAKLGTGPQPLMTVDFDR